MTTTILTDEQIRDLAGTGETSMRANNDMMLARAIEQAVLQSEQVQAWKKDAERLDSGCIVTNERNDFGEEYTCERRGLNLRAAIDAAMERKT